MSVGVFRELPITEVDGEGNDAVNNMLFLLLNFKRMIFAKKLRNIFELAPKEDISNWFLQIAYR